MIREAVTGLLQLSTTHQNLKSQIYIFINMQLNICYCKIAGGSLETKGGGQGVSKVFWMNIEVIVAPGRWDMANGTMRSVWIQQERSGSADAAWSKWRLWWGLMDGFTQVIDEAYILEPYNNKAITLLQSSSPPFYRPTKPHMCLSIPLIVSCFRSHSMTSNTCVQF